MKLAIALAALLLAHPCPTSAAEPTVVFLAKWGLPTIAGPYDVACAPDGTVLVADQGLVKHLSATGVLLEQWLLPPVGINPHGLAALLAIDGQGAAYIPAGFGYVQKLSLSGALLAMWRTQQVAPGQSPEAYGVAVGSDGTIFVSDPSHRNIQRFTPEGQFLLRWGSEGFGPGQFLTVHGIAADHAGRIYAADSGGPAANHRVQVFDLDGHFLFQFGSYGTGDGQFQFLSDIEVDASGHVFVSDEILRRVQEFGPDGTFIAVLGSEGPGDGQFQSVQGIGADSVGNVFIADGSYPRVQKFGPAPVPTNATTWGRIKASYRGL